VESTVKDVLRGDEHIGHVDRAESLVTDMLTSQGPRQEPDRGMLGWLLDIVGPLCYARGTLV
jgi:hypothetical protein